MASGKTTSADVSLVVVASFAFALSSPLAKAAVGLSPIAVGAGRCLVASAAIFAFAGPAVRRALRGMKARTTWSLAGAGALLAAH